MAAATKTAASKPAAAKAPAGKAAPSKAPKSHSGGMIAAVLVRGLIGARHDTLRAMDALRLRRKHICVVVPDDAMHRGMLAKCKDFITYGPIDAAMLEELKAKRKPLKDSEGNPINVFRMHPPRGGFAGKGTKVSYQEGGALGLRREKMADFLRKML